ncbi:MAG: Type I restriction-modification system, specificity subunit S [Candidatus Jettenia ecosi]|uniref:Type I restriction-modification system, specificity subunit S n=1 Tax=Candidatus Jettenia ecosi TaxID=2494326 RepID=A0A533QS38_9BACT|nr:MAG: Type I restriction-modification system, specificity subunit S [Candidatus Jettenia ecosi]
MKRYKKYKDSGIEWVGEIPDHWEIKRLKYLAKVNSSKKNFDLENNSETEVVFLPMEKVSKHGTIDQDLRKKSNEVSTGFTYFERNDIIVAKITPCFENGKGAFLENLETEFGFGSTEFHVLRASNKINKKFLFYQTKTDRFMNIGEAFMIGSAGQKRVPLSFVESFIIGIPQLEEQIAVANYLDEKTIQIDKLISNKQKLIDLLREECTAIINQAVTKDIDPNIKLKPSGIEWLGEIPEHWEVKKLKYVATIQSSNVDKKTNEEEKSILLCNYIDVYKNEFIDDSISFMEATATEKEIEKFILNKGDVLITKDSETPDDIANPAYVVKDFDNVICGYHLAQIRANQIELHGEYLFRLFQSRQFNTHFEVSANGVTRFGLPLDSIADVFVPLPSKEEQLSITEYILKETQKISNTIVKIEKEIKLLQEYRIALISEVVIGKIKVV